MSIARSPSTWGISVHNLPLERFYIADPDSQSINALHPAPPIEHRAFRSSEVRGENVKSTGQLPTNDLSHDVVSNDGLEDALSTSTGVESIFLPQALMPSTPTPEGVAVRKTRELHQPPAGRKQVLPEESPRGRLEAFNREHEARIAARHAAMDLAEESIRIKHSNLKASESDAAEIANAWVKVVEFAGIHPPSMEVATEIMKLALRGPHVRAQERFNRPMHLRQSQDSDSGPSSGSTLYSLQREQQQNIDAPFVQSLGSTAGTSRYPSADSLFKKHDNRHEVRQAEAHSGPHAPVQDHYASKEAQVRMCPVDWVAEALRQSYERMTRDSNLKLALYSQSRCGETQNRAATPSFFGVLTNEEVTKLRLYRTRALSQAVVHVFTMPPSAPVLNGEPLHDWYQELMQLFKHHFHSLIAQAGIEMTTDAFHNVAGVHIFAILTSIHDNWGILPLDHPHATGTNPDAPLAELAHKAYHLTMAKPSHPPPAGWAPPSAVFLSHNADPQAVLHPFYQSIIHRFSRAFKLILQSHDDPLVDPAMDAELEDLIDRHVVNLMGQFRQVLIEEFKMAPRCEEPVRMPGGDQGRGKGVHQMGVQGENVVGQEYPVYEQNLNMHVLHGMNSERWGL